MLASDQVVFLGADGIYIGSPVMEKSLTVQSTVTEFGPDYPRCWCGECLAAHWRQRPCLRREIARCDAELANIGAAQASGHPDGTGLLMAEADWRIERKMIEKENTCQTV